MAERALIGRRPTVRAIHCLAALLILGACAAIKPATVPMRTVLTEGPGDGALRTLFVMLPGYGDPPERFGEHGFADIVQAALPHADVVYADAHFGYYRRMAVLERLAEDVIGPLRERYAQIWLVGVSMGGLGAAAYAMQHHPEVSGVFLLAPFLGPDRVVAEVADAGGLRLWDPPQLATIEDPQTRLYYGLWAWLKQNEDTRIYLGYGERDRLSPANRLLAEVLPSTQLEVQPGGHKWRTWTPIFAALVDRAAEQHASPDSLQACAGNC